MEADGRQGSGWLLPPGRWPSFQLPEAADTRRTPSAELLCAASCRGSVGTDSPKPHTLPDVLSDDGGAAAAAQRQKGSTRSVNSGYSQRLCVGSDRALVVHFNAHHSGSTPPSEQLAAQARVAVPALCNFLYFGGSSVAVVYFGKSRNAAGRSVGIDDGDELKQKLLRILMFEVWPTLRTDTPLNDYDNAHPAATSPHGPAPEFPTGAEAHRSPLGPVIAKSPDERRSRSPHPSGNARSHRAASVLTGGGPRLAAAVMEKASTFEQAPPEVHHDPSVQGGRRGTLPPAPSPTRPSPAARDALKSPMQALVFLKAAANGTRYVKLVLSGIDKLRFDVTDARDSKHRWENRRLHIRMLDSLETERAVLSYDEYERALHEACSFAAENPDVEAEAALAAEAAAAMAALQSGTGTDSGELSDDEVDVFGTTVSPALLPWLAAPPKPLGEVCPSTPPSQVSAGFPTPPPLSDAEMPGAILPERPASSPKGEQRVTLTWPKSFHYRYHQTLSIPESATLDYKSYFHDPAGEIDARALKFLCGFLNAYGHGRIVVGVHEVKAYELPQGPDSPSSSGLEAPVPDGTSLNPNPQDGVVQTVVGAFIPKRRSKALARSLTRQLQSCVPPVPPSIVQLTFVPVRMPKEIRPATARGNVPGTDKPVAARVVVLCEGTMGTLNKDTNHCNRLLSRFGLSLVPVSLGVPLQTDKRPPTPLEGLMPPLELDVRWQVFAIVPFADVPEALDGTQVDPFSDRIEAALSRGKTRDGTRKMVRGAEECILQHFAAPPIGTPRMVIYSDGTNWWPYTAENSAAVLRALGRLAAGEAAGPITVAAGRQEYAVDAVKMVQRNLKTGRERAIRAIPFPRFVARPGVAEPTRSDVEAAFVHCHLGGEHLPPDAAYGGAEPLGDWLLATMQRAHELATGGAGQLPEWERRLLQYLQQQRARHYGPFSLPAPVPALQTHVVDISIDLRRLPPGHRLRKYTGKFFNGWPSLPVWNPLSHNVDRAPRAYRLLTAKRRRERRQVSSTPTRATTGDRLCDADDLSVAMRVLEFMPAAHRRALRLVSYGWDQAFQRSEGVGLVAPLPGDRLASLRPPGTGATAYHAQLAAYGAFGPASAPAAVPLHPATASEDTAERAVVAARHLLVAHTQNSLVALRRRATAAYHMGSRPASGTFIENGVGGSRSSARRRTNLLRRPDAVPRPSEPSVDLVVLPAPALAPLLLCWAWETLGVLPAPFPYAALPPEQAQAAVVGAVGATGMRLAPHLITLFSLPAAFVDPLVVGSLLAAAPLPAVVLDMSDGLAKLVVPRPESGDPPGTHYSLRPLRGVQCDATPLPFPADDPVDLPPVRVAFVEDNGCLSAEPWTLKRLLLWLRVARAEAVALPRVGGPPGQFFLNVDPALVCSHHQTAVPPAPGADPGSALCTPPPPHASLLSFPAMPAARVSPFDCPLHQMELDWAQW